MKSRISLLRRAITLILALVFLAGPMASPASEVRADEEFSFDESTFKDPEYTTSMMYYWHTGLPTVQKDKQGNYIQYPVLICWKDQYFLCADEDFKNELNETHTKQLKKNDHHKFFGLSDGYVESDCYSADDYDRVWGDADYYMRYLYDTTDKSLLAKLGMDLDSLNQYGESVSMTCPELPYIIPADLSKDQYAIGLPESVFKQNVWLTGCVTTWEWVYVSGMVFKTEYMCGDVQWELDYVSWDPDLFLDPTYVYKETRTTKDVNSTKSFEYTEGADQHYWTIKQDSSGQYHLWTTGMSLLGAWDRITDYGRDWNRNRMRQWFHANDLGRMSLYYSGSKIGVNAETVKNKDWKNRNCTIDNTDAYSIYYADPNIVSFYLNSFTVEKGQVINLDGPLVLDNQCTVTVKDGGVLSCSGWVINNGQIIVEPGGMLILQERSTATGDSQFGLISSMGVEAGTASGRIACDGTMIINRDCKLSCAGSYGLQLGSTAQVVNYGQIIAENLEVYNDHTIENRGNTSAVFAGWGVTDSGYALSRLQIIGQDYNAKGNREKTCFVSVPQGAVYGAGAERFYVNPDQKVNYFTSSRKKGGVSGHIAYIDGTTYVPQPELPTSVPIYYDEEYGVAFIKIVGDIYQYNPLVGRWVSIADGGDMTFFEYRLPEVVERYVPDKLPDGFILYDGRVVGQKAEGVVEVDLQYDWRAYVFWCYVGDTFYYYESQLHQYIHVLDESTYCVCKENLAPPPYESSSYVPGEMYNMIPMDAMLYRDGMTEVPNTLS